MVANLSRLILAAALVLATLGALESNARAAQPVANTWTEPGGAFSLHWEEPWVVQRQEPGLLLVANGSTAAVASLSFPTADLNPSLCLDAYVDATAPPEVKSQPPIMEGKTSWRAYAAYDNLQVGAVDYFECQVTPDGAAFAIFAGGTTLMEKYGNIPMLIDFLGQWVVRPDGEQGPVVAADGWRLGVVDWVRGSVYADLGLPPAPAGSDYLIVVADLSNWASTGTELSLGSIGALAADSSSPTAVDLEASRLVAETLGETPVEDVLVVESGATRRIVLAFTVPTTATEIGISLGGSALSLIDDGIPARLVVLPSPVGAPAMQSGVVSDVIDGRTLLVTLEDTSQSERVRLIGVDASLDDAVAHLAGYVGQRVMLESDPAHPDDNRLQRYVWVTGDAGLPVLLNESLIEQGLASYDMSSLAGRFDVMLATANGASPTEAGREEVIQPVTPQPDIMAVPELERVLAEVDAAPDAAGIQTDGLVSQ